MLESKADMSSVTLTMLHNCLTAEIKLDTSVHTWENVSEWQQFLLCVCCYKMGAWSPLQSAEGIILQRGNTAI